MKQEHEFLYDFETSYESVRLEKGFTHKQMAKEMNITLRYLLYLRKGKRKGIKGKGKIVQEKIKKDYQKFFKLVHFLIIVYYTSTEKYRFVYKQRRVNINELKSGNHNIVFRFAKGEIVSVNYTVKKSNVPELINEILNDYNKKDIMNYTEMVMTGINIKQTDDLLDRL